MNEDIAWLLDNGFHEYEQLYHLEGPLRIDVVECKVGLWRAWLTTGEHPVSVDAVTAPTAKGAVMALAAQASRAFEREFIINKATLKMLGLELDGIVSKQVKLETDNKAIAEAFHKAEKIVRGETPTSQ